MKPRRETRDKAALCLELAKRLTDIGMTFGFEMSQAGGNVQDVSDVEKLLVRAGSQMYRLAVSLKAKAEEPEPMPLFDQVKPGNEAGPTHQERWTYDPDCDCRQCKPLHQRAEAPPATVREAVIAASNGESLALSPDPDPKRKAKARRAKAAAVLDDGESPSKCYVGMIGNRHVFRWYAHTRALAEETLKQRLVDAEIDNPRLKVEPVVRSDQFMTLPMLSDLSDSTLKVALFNAEHAHA